MLSPRLSFVALWLTTTMASVRAATGGSFQAGGNTQISAMMMFLGNEDSVYILDKAEGNAAQILGHPAWGAVWDITSHSTTLMDIRTNSFCASGMHLPNGSFVTFGGNDAVGVNGAPGSQKNADGRTGAWDSGFQDFDGRKAIRILNPCKSTDNLAAGANCGWYDDPTTLSMQKFRWYSAAEAIGDGSVLILGGMVTGGYINRWFPDVDPVTELGSAENTYEYYPARPAGPQLVQFLVKTSGLNAYAHTYLMPSGNVLVQSNLSTMLWDHVNNKEFPLPDMPNGVVRVYPASGAVAMLPLTPKNNYTPTMLFCGGSSMAPDGFGAYAGPAADTWTIPASQDCQRLTPEPIDGSTPAYEQDDNMLEGRTMGQFILLPDGKALVINGGLNGTAGYSLGTKDTPQAQMPFGVSLAAGPVMTPALYDPNAPKGSRWSNSGLGLSQIPRLYHSSAILLPDASVLVAGSNPNPDVDLNAFFPTEYRADIFYPPYFSAPIRPAPTGMPTTLSYGGAPFDITIPSSSYSGVANDAADASTVVVVRGGFTTHAMNMGQRFLQLNNTYTVNKDASITLHVSQMPPNSNIFQPGPALMFVTISGIPSNGSYVIIGNGVVGTQPLSPVTPLPPSIRLDKVTGGTTAANGTTTGTSASHSPTSGSGLSSAAVRIGAIAGGIALVAIIAAIAGIIIMRRKKSAARGPTTTYPLDMTSNAGPVRGANAPFTANDNNSSIFSPLNKQSHQYDDAWDPSTASLNAPYRDSMQSGSGHPSQEFDSYDPYSQSGYHAASHQVAGSNLRYGGGGYQ